MSAPMRPAPPVQTTVPEGDDPRRREMQLPSWALVLVWSAVEPNRVGEVAFLPAMETCLFGRGDTESKVPFVLFGRHRPGEAIVRSSVDGILAGQSISRRQLELLATAAGIEMVRKGSCKTFVNGVESDRATLQEGDLVLLGRQVMLRVVRRQRVLPGPTGRLHEFGEADAAGIVGEGPAAWTLREKLAVAAATDHLVLLLGESGTGKELAANAIHRASQYAEGPLVSHNCGVATDTLNESKLFGNVVNYPERGTAARPGLLGRAAGGTLFLDELGDCPLDVQTMLLRAFDSGEYEPQGADAPRRIKLRVIGATNRPQSMLRGDFRFRFNHPIHLPPLRERREDIALLIRHWFRTCLEDYPQMVRRIIQKSPTGSLEPRLSPQLVEYILRDPLKGNVRELNEVLWLALRGSAGDELDIPESMPEWQSRLQAPDAGPESGEEESDAEDEAEDDGRETDPTKEEVLAALEAEPKNFSAAAKKLGRGRKVLMRLMVKYGIKREKTDER